MSPSEASPSRRYDHAPGEIWVKTGPGDLLQHCAHCGAPVGCDSSGAFFVHERCGDIGPLCEMCVREEAEWYGNTTEAAFDRWMQAWDELFAVTLIPFGEWGLRTLAPLVEKYRRWRKKA